MPNFYTGQRIVCIDDGFHPSVFNWGTTVPTIGHCYTIRKLVPNGQHPLDGHRGLGFHLTEIVNPSPELCFAEWRFAPLDELADEAVEENEKEFVLVG